MVDGKTVTNTTIRKIALEKYIYIYIGEGDKRTHRPGILYILHGHIVTSPEFCQLIEFENSVRSL